MTLSAKSSLILGENNAAVCREGHYNCILLVLGRRPLYEDHNLKNHVYFIYLFIFYSWCILEEVSNYYLFSMFWLSSISDAEMHQCLFLHILKANASNFLLMGGLQALKHVWCLVKDTCSKYWTLNYSLNGEILPPTFTYQF